MIMVFLPAADKWASKKGC